MDKLNGCQIPCVSKITEGEIGLERMPLIPLIKRSLALPWNLYVKKNLKGLMRLQKKLFAHSPQTAGKVQGDISPVVKLAAGDWVKVRSEQEIKATLDNWKELKGCAFMPEMWQYCGTVQQVLQPVERFLDERDYKVKKSKGIILLHGVMCQGTEVFGRCDRRCHFFWREEWLEKISPIEAIHAEQSI